MNIRLDVKLQSAGFTTASEFRADLIVYLNEHSIKQQLGRNQHKVIRKLSPVPSRETPPGHNLERKDGRKLAYLVCQLAGRWVAERNWIVPFVYDSKDEELFFRDYDTCSNLNTRSSTSPMANSPQFFATRLQESDSKDNPEVDIPTVCKAALDDALHWGSCGVEGYSGFIFRYSPQVILANHNITAEQFLTIRISCQLPDFIPPTFRGTSMKYQYLLAIVAADASRVDKPQVLRIPLIITTSLPNSVVRPIYIPWTTVPNYKEQSHLLTKLANNSFRVHTGTMPNRNNIQRVIALSPNGRITPFHKREDDPTEFAVRYPISEESIFDCDEEPIEEGVVEQEENIQGPNTFPFLSQKEDLHPVDENIQNVYQIKQDADVVCRIYIWRRSFRCGDSIVGFVEFTKSKIPCYRMTIRLETEERVHPRACNHSSTSPLIFRKTYGERIEYPSFEQNTEFMLTIPLDAPVSLETNAVSFLWLLRFSFEIPNGPVDAKDRKYNELLPIPLSGTDYLLQRNTKLLNWCLPLVVYGGDRLAFVPDTVVGLDLLYDS